ncbi:hypothetical protein [Streptomyces chartreusis]|uniref:hypothetical protein n=1 Tax=Streptomyces chartreusis TaxID=1969 RepID=UPI00381EFF7F
MTSTPLRLRVRLHTLGTARLRIAVLFAALAATTLTLLTSLPAQAAPTPSPSPSTSSDTQTPGGSGAATPEEVAEFQDFLEEQSERLSKSAQSALLAAKAEDVRKQLPDEGGILGVFNVTDANGLPISVYTVQSDTGSFLRWDLGVLNLLTEGCYMITKWLIAFCCWLIGWSLSFGLAKLLLAPALAIANSLHSRVIMELGLPSLFLAVCALICTCRIFFGDRAKGWGDAALSIVLAALTTTLLASTPQLLLGEDSGAVAATRGLALEVADVILDADPTTTWANNDVTTPATSFTLSRPLTDSLTEAFVVRPAMLLQYGRVFDGACATEYADKRLEQLAYDRQVDQIADRTTKLMRTGDITPGDAVAGPLDWPTQTAMKWAAHHYGGVPMEEFEEQCVKGDAIAAKRASLDKLGGSFFLLIAAVIVTVLIVGLAGSFLTAQCRIAWDAIRGEPALIAGTIPGAGRAFLWDVCASVWRNLAQLLVSVTSLAVFIIIVKTVLDPVQTDWGNELTLRFLAVDVVCIAAVKKRKALQARTHQVANNLKAKLSSNRIGGTHGSILTPAADPLPKSSHLGRKTARGMVRGTLATAALVTGRPMAAVAYAMPQSVGATALLTRLGRGPRGRSRQQNANPAGQPAQPQAGSASPPPPPGPASPPPAAAMPPAFPAGPGPGSAPNTASPSSAPARRATTTPPRPTSPPRPTTPPRNAPPPRPTHRPGTQPARLASTVAATTAPRARPRHQPPTQPARSPQQQQLRRRLDRGIRRTPPAPRRSLQPNRADRDAYDAYLREQEDAELARRTETEGDATDA